ncbi:MAG: glycine-rich domain-containing protein [Burkholderiales bacterium]
MLSRTTHNAISDAAGDLPAAVAALNFAAIKQKLRDPAESSALSEDQVATAECEYRRFLALHVWHPDAELVPSKLVDHFWHAHIVDTVAYVNDCGSAFGEYLHHYPYMGMGSPEAKQELENAFEKTKALYEMHFGCYPEAEMAAARCAGHACHVKPSCACRVPGACKSHSGASARPSNCSVEEE